MFSTSRSTIDGADTTPLRRRYKRAHASTRLARPLTTAHSTNSAIDAVNPCSALRPAIGPISPAAKNPASGIPPSKSEIVDASWSATPNIRRPRALHVNNSAPTGRPGSSAAARSTEARRSVEAPAASRTWNCTVAPTSTTSPTWIAPVEGSAPSKPRMMKSPGPEPPGARRPRSRPARRG